VIRAIAKSLLWLTALRHEIPPLLHSGYRFAGGPAAGCGKGHSNRRAEAARRAHTRRALGQVDLPSMSAMSSLSRVAIKLPRGSTQTRRSRLPLATRLPDLGRGLRLSPKFRRLPETSQAHLVLGSRLKSARHAGSGSVVGLWFGSYDSRCRRRRFRGRAQSGWGWEHPAEVEDKSESLRLVQRRSPERHTARARSDATRVSPASSLRGDVSSTCLAGCAPLDGRGDRSLTGHR
jgi:hypothetical protein